ncbi:MAG: type II secretion system F family protein [Candidatus Hydrogenedens sp.]|nr:type II secretion system F family protein [Candidatus Hydrogenedentota bacterium]NLF56386.1 type II secretion system F family protein [Candidatus Hydrogenedens sp.]
MADTPEKNGAGRVRRVTGKRKPAEEAPLQESGGPGGLQTLLSAGGIHHADITVFLRQLIMLLESGTPILKSLRTLARRGKRAGVRDLVVDIAAFVENGSPLWAAFERHPRHFDAVFVSLIKASEASGTLTTVLRRLVDYRTARELLRKRVRSAMIYPVLLVVACLAAMLVISSFVVPVFADFFSRAGLEVPGPTRFLIAASEVARVAWWVPIAALLVLLFAYKLWYVRNPLRRLTADRLKLGIPLIGPIIHKNALVEMTRTLGLLLRSGLSMMASLDLTRNAIHNRAVAESLQAMRNSVERGGGLEEPMRQSAVIPDEVTDMIATGEESGRVDAVAEQIADIYEEEVSIAVAGLGEALQPVFTLVIGLAVLILFVALFLPMIGMIDQLGAS